MEALFGSWYDLVFDLIVWWHLVYSSLFNRFALSVKKVYMLIILMRETYISGKCFLCSTFLWEYFQEKKKNGVFFCEDSNTIMMWIKLLKNKKNMLFMVSHLDDVLALFLVKTSKLLQFMALFSFLLKNVIE